VCAQNAGEGCVGGGILRPHPVRGTRRHQQSRAHRIADHSGEFGSVEQSGATDAERRAYLLTRANTPAEGQKDATPGFEAFSAYSTFPGLT
jgi:hypothetical protein